VLFPIALFVDNVALAVAVVTIVLAGLAAAVAPIDALVALVTPHRLRGVGFALRGLYGASGAVIGGLLLGMVSDAFGERTALVCLLPPTAVAGGILVASAARHVRSDVGAMVVELKEDVAERRRQATAVAGSTPLLQVRGLDFSYGAMQVLFGVDLEVHEGEVLALLGTNGAGKSTLLRAVSGLDLHDRGSIRFEGRHIGLVGAEERVDRGIVLVPGGRATFPSLTVRENLVAGAWTFVWDTGELAERVTEVVERFPRLGERLDQPAGSLSGGEQQMLALAKALLLRPRLLIIDELSLGLAPAVVQDLLEVVRSLRRDGVTVVIVEQSLNVALSVADRAVFMEKGQIRFEGSPQELLERDDLARAVFLGGEH
jgi:ABC-type branched-subunit amino acid transport system ATPase component